MNLTRSDWQWESGIPSSCWTKFSSVGCVPAFGVDRLPPRGRPLKADPPGSRLHPGGGLLVDGQTLLQKYNLPLQLVINVLQGGKACQWDGYHTLQLPLAGSASQGGCLLPRGICLRGVCPGESLPRTCLPRVVYPGRGCLLVGGVCFWGVPDSCWVYVQDGSAKGVSARGSAGGASAQGVSVNIPSPCEQND